MKPRLKNSVTIVIPTLNRENALVKTLRRCIKQVYPPELFEIILVNDGEPLEKFRRLRSFLKKIKDPEIRLIHQNHQGAGSARNRGAIEGKGEFLCFFDDDTLPSPFCIKNHVKLLNRTSSIVSQGLILPSPQTSLTDRLIWQDLFPSLLKHKEDLCFRMITANLGIKRSFFLKSGLFDPNFKTIEDYELGFRLVKDLNMHVRFNKYAVVWHESPRDFKSFFSKSLETGKALLQFFKKHEEKSYLKHSPKPIKLLPPPLELKKQFTQLSSKRFTKICSQVTNLEKKYLKTKNPKILREILQIYKIFSLYALGKGFWGSITKSSLLSEQSPTAPDNHSS